MAGDSASCVLRFDRCKRLPAVGYEDLIPNESLLCPPVEEMGTTVNIRMFVDIQRTKSFGDGYRW